MRQGRLFPEELDSSGSASSWRQRELPPAGFAARLGLPQFQATLLYNRGVRHVGDVDPFLVLDGRLLHDPLLLSDMDRAADLLSRAAEDGCAVAVYGDFDVDGITGAAIICRAVRDLGGRPIPYIPNRMSEGHGLHATAVRRLAAAGASLLVTVDCGTTDVAEVTLARTTGMDVIVTDHHRAPTQVNDDIPVVNPSLEEGYPFTGLTGAGVALKLAQAAYERSSRPFPGSLFELAALGTVADVAPLTGENRFIVGRGLISLRGTKSVGIEALARRSNIDLSAATVRDLSFGLIPRLNSAGRLDDPVLSLRLLTTSDASEANELSETLERLNSQRRKITERGIQDAEEIVSKSSQDGQAALVVYSPDWHPGVLGLIASRLSERYRRPVVAATLLGGAVRASARGPEGYKVVDAIGATRLPFLRIGGHLQAAGFTLDECHLKQFSRLFPAKVAEMSEGPAPSTPIEYDCELQLQEVDCSNYSFITSLAPFGKGNPVPTFLTRDVQVREGRAVGRDQAHLKLWLAADGVHLNAIAFNQSSKLAELGPAIDLVYSINLNEWNGRRHLELKVVDLRPAF